MKIKNLIAVAALLMGSTSTFAQSTDVEYSANGLDYTCTLPAKTAVVKGVTKGAEAPATLTIADKIKPTGTGAEATIKDQEFTIVAIGAEAFKGKTAITKVELPATVTIINASAFEGLTGLTVANFSWAPSSAAQIYANAFKGCTSFGESYTLPRKVEYIGASAFENTALKTLSFGAKSNLAFVGANFIKGTAITELDFTPAGSNLVTPPDYAFSCSTLKKIVFAKDWDADVAAYDYENDNITNISTTGGISMFTGATALQEIVFPSTLATIDDDALAQTVLTSLDLSKTSVTTVNNIFAATSTLPFESLKSVTFSNAETTIMAGAFAYCTGLKAVEFPAAWSTNGLVKDGAFEGCTGLTTVTFKPTSPTSFSTSGNVFGLFGKDAFKGSKSGSAKIKIATNEAYVNAVVKTNAPTCTTYDYTPSTPTTPTWEINMGSNTQAFKMFTDGTSTFQSVKIAASDAVVYSVYVDDDGTDDSDGTIYIYPYRISAGYYVVDVDEPFIIKAKNGASKVTAIKQTGYSSTCTYGWDLGCNLTDGITVTSLAGTDYLYVGAIKDGTLGFGKPASNSLAKGTYYVVTKKPYSSSGRLNVVWVDENDATAIQAIQNKVAAKKGAIYNLSGQKVNASYKGVVIKDGKKYIQK